MRAVTALVVSVLAAGPAFALLCDALCSDHPYETASAEAVHDASHHQASATHEPAAHAVDRVKPVADGVNADQSPLTATVSFPEFTMQLNGSLARDCCTSRGQPHLSRTAGRADTGLLSPPQAPVLFSVVVFDPLDRRALGPMRASPTGLTAPVRATLVLRI
jgi:hypothetical protein